MLKTLRIKTRNLLRRQNGQALVEAALAIPILMLLFAGCLQLIQLGVAHIVVQEAAYEAGRQAHADQYNLGQARRVAEEICRSLGAGATELELDQSTGRCTVTHHLQTILPVAREIPVRSVCQDRTFKAGERPQ